MLCYWFYVFTTFTFFIKKRNYNAISQEYQQQSRKKNFMHDDDKYLSIFLANTTCACVRCLFSFFFYIQMLWIEIRRYLFSDDFVCLCHITNFSNRQIITNWNFLFCFVFAPLFEIFDDLRKFKFFDWKIFFLKSVYSMFGSLHGFFLTFFSHQILTNKRA